jgi:hypothetical protein
VDVPKGKLNVNLAVFREAALAREHSKIFKAIHSVDNPYFTNHEHEKLSAKIFNAFNRYWYVLHLWS